MISKIFFEAMGLKPQSKFQNMNFRFLQAQKRVNNVCTNDPNTQECQEAKRVRDNARAKMVEKG